MSRSVNDRYLEGRVLSASPVELVRILYDAAGESVREARRHLAAGDIAARSRQISRASAVLTELAASLDRSRGGELAGQLAELYDYMQRRLAEANLRQEDGPLADVLGLLTTLGEAWQALGAGEPPAAAAAAPALEPEYAAGYGAFMPGRAYAAASGSWSA